ncbi:hypothetical protein AAY473_037089 [Plecturocebus cupreus]
MVFNHSLDTIRTVTVHRFRCFILAFPQSSKLIQTTVWLMSSASSLTPTTSSSSRAHHFMARCVRSSQQAREEAELDEFADLISLPLRHCLSRLLGRLRQENHLNPGGGGCSELRSCHCTAAWATEQDSVSKNTKKKTNLKEKAALWEAGVDGLPELRVQDQPAQHGETPSLLQYRRKLARCGGACLWPQLLGRARQNCLNPRGRSCSEAAIAPLHSSLSDRARLCSHLHNHSTAPTVLQTALFPSAVFISQQNQLNSPKDLSGRVPPHELPSLLSSRANRCASFSMQLVPPRQRGLQTPAPSTSEGLCPIGTSVSTTRLRVSERREG